MRQHIFVQGKLVPSLGRFENQPKDLQFVSSMGHQESLLIKIPPPSTNTDIIYRHLVAFNISKTFWQLKVRSY